MQEYFSFFFLFFYLTHSSSFHSELLNIPEFIYPLEMYLFSLLSYCRVVTQDTKLISGFLNLQRFVLCSRIWPNLEKHLCVVAQNVYSLVFQWNILWISVRPRNGKYTGSKLQRTITYFSTQKALNWRWSIANDLCYPLGQTISNSPIQDQRWLAV